MKRYLGCFKKSWKGWEYVNERACNKRQQTHESVRRRSGGEPFGLKRTARVYLWIFGAQWSRKDINDQNASRLDEADFRFSACFGNGYTRFAHADSAPHRFCQREKDFAAVPYSQRACAIQPWLLPNLVRPSGRKIRPPA